ncbi:helix-turn-helix domain-containing protein [Microbacterium aquimaris]
MVRAVAQDLSVLPDSERVLTGLARRVRAAIGSDLAYLSLNDPDSQETRIRFSDGIRTPAYAAIRMPIGTGVLGMAAAGVTTESADYLPDLARLHVDAVDATVKAEGVRAILATAIRTGGEVIGALTVANRAPGGFSPAQRAQLEEAALIASAAVAIYLLKEERDHLRRAQERQSERHDAQTSAWRAELALSNRLSRALAEGMDSDQIMSVAADQIAGDVRLVTGDAPMTDGARTVPLDAGGVLEVSSPRPEAQALTDVIGSFVSTSLLYEQAIEDARHLREAELVERLIGPGRPDDRAARSGLPGDGPLDVVVAEIDDPLRRRRALADVRRVLGDHALATIVRGSVLTVTRGARARSRVAESLRPHRHFGGTASASDDTCLPDAYGEADLLARASRRLNRGDRLTTWDDLGVVAYAVGGAPPDADRLIRSRLGPISGPSTRDAVLRDTALRYLDAQGAVSTVARDLGVHENTVRQRLSRLDQLLSGWRDGPERLDVHVALRAYDLIAVSEPRPSTT